MHAKVCTLVVTYCLAYYYGDRIFEWCKNNLRFIVLNIGAMGLTRPWRRF